MFLYNFHLLIIANHDKTDVILKTNFLFYSANIYMCTCWIFSWNCWNCGKESRFLTIHTKSKRKQISSVVLSKYEFRAYWHCKIFYLQRRNEKYWTDKYAPIIQWHLDSMKPDYLCLKVRQCWSFSLKGHGLALSTLSRKKIGKRRFQSENAWNVFRSHYVRGIF